MANRPSVVFFGTTNELSLTALETLVVSDVMIAAVFVTADTVSTDPDSSLELLQPAKLAGELPLVNPFFEPNLLHTAWSAEIPVYGVKSAHAPELAELLDTLRPDAACVACFPWKLPVALLSVPPLGFLNVHPSLLPYYRGPAPLFWLFQRADLTKRGVSVHLMDAGLDTGPLLRRQPLQFPDGLGQLDVERACGALGGQLLVQALEKLAAGDKGLAQPADGSYYPWPEPVDYALDTAWSARQAFNFMRATNGEAATYPVRDMDLTLIDALDCIEQGRLSAPLEVGGRVALIQFSTGILKAKIARPSSRRV
ncbi:MAG: hypothetical protein JSW55_19035 [Chloroflexota bacterium]|nr:MAG: hypothetical protein JSW55_19035 [Chloroflexota bacterium]